jgi:hypothetical protein
MRAATLSTTVSSIDESTSIEPLFAASGSLWLRVWIATQAVALGIALYVVMASDQPAASAAQSRSVPMLPAIVALLIVYHAVGVRAHRWILRRGWATALFVPVGWVLIIASLRFGAAFALLILGAINQGFVFLPFTWAVGVLVVLIAIYQALHLFKVI